MLFSAGMGIGLVFNGVAEPLSHFVSPPDVSGNEPGSQAAANSAVGLSLFHWGLHAWGIYALVGLGLAYMTYRYGRPLSVRWLLEPIMGRRLIESWVGNLIDTVAIIGTVFGVATSLGLGVLQIQAGLAHLGWFEPSNTLVIALVVGITAAGTVSVVSGVDRGIRWLSNSNMGMAALLAIVVLVAGPTVFLVRSVVQNSGEYLQTIPQLAFVTGAGVDDGWTLGWTLFNQAWFLSWAPFVGMFIARISRGRTIREFILGVLLAPTAVSIVWLTIFGGSGIFYQLDDGSLVGDDGTVNSDTSLFQMLNELPIGNEMASALAIVAIIVIMLFFITSVDSCSLVVDVLSHGGRSETPRQTRVFWAVLVGLCGGVLLLAGGEAALTVLQVSSLAGAAPLSIVYALGMVSLWKLFRYLDPILLEQLVRRVEGGRSCSDDRYPRRRPRRGKSHQCWYACLRRGLAFRLRELGIDPEKILLPRFEPGVRNDRAHRACADARATIDAHVGIDVEHVGSVEIGLVRRRMDAIDRAGVHTARICTTGLGDDVGHVRLASSRMRRAVRCGTSKPSRRFLVRARSFATGDSSAPTSRRAFAHR